MYKLVAKTLIIRVLQVSELLNVPVLMLIALFELQLEIACFSKCLFSSSSLVMCDFSPLADGTSGTMAERERLNLVHKAIHVSQGQGCTEEGEPPSV